MASEPAEKRGIAVFDGQNPYYAARNSFGYTYPNYDPLKLAQAVCHSRGWRLQQTFFYTGVPDIVDNAFWHHSRRRRRVADHWWNRKRDSHRLTCFASPLPGRLLG